MMYKKTIRLLMTVVLLSGPIFSINQVEAKTVKKAVKKVKNRVDKSQLQKFLDQYKYEKRLPEYKKGKKKLKKAYDAAIKAGRKVFKNKKASQHKVELAAEKIIKTAFNLNRDYLMTQKKAKNTSSQ